jgi:mannose-6-phosphate isomerase-like protein (cupin superfamily)
MTNHFELKPVNLLQKCNLISDHWSPRVVAEMNDYQFKVVKIEGDFVWHKHENTDETFFVIEGELRIDFRDGAVILKPGEIFVVPKGIEHKPFAKNEVKIMLIEPKGVVNTGDSKSSNITADNDIWV